MESEPRQPKPRVLRQYLFEDLQQTENADERAERLRAEAFIESHDFEPERWDGLS